MEFIIRKETPDDYKGVFRVIRKAFENEHYSDHREQELVSRLRRSKHFIPELSLVGVMNETIIAHVLLSEITINDTSESHRGLALAPVSVLPEYQNQGFGTLMVEEAHRIARQLGFRFAVVMGHKEYYPRFGYKPAKDYKLKPAFKAPEGYFMAVELEKEALANIQGVVVYPIEFF